MMMMMMIDDDDDDHTPTVQSKSNSEREFCSF